MCGSKLELLEMPEKVQNWRAALTELSNISGWASKNCRSEAQLVEIIVSDVLRRLVKSTVSTVSKGLVGLNSRIERVEALLRMESSDISLIVGIWGMGGIGKTTLANVIYNKFLDKFEGSCFMEDVGRKLETRFGLQDLQNQILSKIVDAEDPHISQFTKEMVRHMKVFIVLDDVNKFEQLDVLIGGLDQYGPGSRIVVTTRNKRVLENFGVEKIYRVKQLQNHKAFELFCNYAFKKSRCPEELEHHSWRVVHYVKGNPLALKVLGSSLHLKRKTDWENALENLNEICSSDIYDLYRVLKISFKELTPKEESIFLDIACFLVGDDKDFVANILDDPQSYVIDALLDKSLITISHSNELQMHDLVQEMGRMIVLEESKEPGERSRLWHYKDIRQVLKHNKGTEKIEGIFLDLSKTKDIPLSPGAFANIPNLRLLKFYISGRGIKSSKIHLDQGLEYLPRELRYLHWHEYPLKTLPSDFKPKNLVELNLRCNKLEQLWEGKKKASKLRSINLQYSQDLIRMPDLSETPNLERANLWNCEKLSCVTSSIQNFNRLRQLCFRGCESLRSFPRNLHFVSPVIVDFSLCVNLVQFPLVSGKVIELCLRKTAIEEVPSSIECLADLEKLDLSWCIRLKRLSTSIYKLKFLLELYLSGSLNLESFPEVRLERTASTELPSSIENQEGLGSFSGCRGLASLMYLHLSDCALMKIPLDIGVLSSLKELDLSGNNFGSLHTSIKQLSWLDDLNLTNCKMLESLPELPLSLRYLRAHNCHQLQSLPDIPPCAEELDTSMLERLSNPSENRSRGGLRPYWRKEYCFTNCMKLNEKENTKILADSQLRIQQMALESLRLTACQNIDRVPMVGDSTSDPLVEIAAAIVTIFLPGSEIPGWFQSQSSGSSITILLPQDCCVRNLVGFAFCIVSEFLGDCGDPYAYIDSSCRFEVKIHSNSIDDVFYMERVPINSDHVMLGFQPFCNVRLSNSSRQTTVSFKFITEVYKVKCFGVCPVFANPKEGNPNKSTLKFVAGTKIRSTSGTAAEEESETSANVGSSDEEVLEPSPKRTRR